MKRGVFLGLMLFTFSFGLSLRIQLASSQSQRSLCEQNSLNEIDLSSLEKLEAEYEQEHSLASIGSIDSNLHWYTSTDDWQPYSGNPKSATATQGEANVPDLGVIRADPVIDLSLLSLSLSSLLAIHAVSKSSKHLSSRERLLWLIAIVFVACGGFIIGRTTGQASVREVCFEFIPATTYYEVETDGIFSWATRHDGQLAFGGSANAGGINGTDAVAVINSALNSLTSGRTGQQKVSLRGRFECGNSLSIKIPSYTILDLSEAEIVDARSPNNKGKGSKQIIENSDLNGNTRITIIGGHIDGQRGNYSSQTTGEGDAIRLVNCTDSVVLQTYIKNVARSGLMTISCEYCLFIDVTAENCGGFGQIEQTGDSDCVWLRCIARDSNISGSGFNWCSYAEKLSFITCEAINNSAGEGFGSSNTIEGRINFYECKAEFNGRNGFYLHYGETLHNCIAKDNSQSLPLSYDGMTTDGSTGFGDEGVVIMGGASYDDQTNKTQRFGLNLNSARSMAIGVDCKGNGHADYDISWFVGLAARNSVSMCKGRIQYQGYFSPQPSLPSSGVSRTNTYGVQCMVFISGGNVSEVAINGQATGLTSGSFLLNPHDNITTIYTSDPTWRWFAYGNMDL